MKIVEVATGKEVVVEVRPMEKKDFDRVLKKNGWQFNWKLEREKEVFKLVPIQSPNEILGLMAITEEVESRYIRINLLEASPGNIGKGKKYDRIIGCLLAFACVISIERGYNGFVGLIPKTVLWDHYRKKYGLVAFWKQLGTSPLTANLLINKYIHDE